MVENSNFGFLIPNRVFVGGLDSQTTLEELKLFFKKYGEVKYCNIFEDKKGSRKKYGFITFEKKEEAEKVINSSEDLILHGRKINIGPAVRKKTANELFENVGQTLVLPIESCNSNGILSPNLTDITFNSEQPVISNIYPTPNIMIPNFLPLCQNQLMIGSGSHLMQPFANISDTYILPSQHNYITSNIFPTTYPLQFLPSLTPINFVPTIDNMKEEACLINSNMNSLMNLTSTNIALLKQQMDQNIKPRFLPQKRASSQIFSNEYQPASKICKSVLY